MQEFQPALNVLQTQSHIAFIQFIKIGLGNTTAIVMEANIQFITTQVLSKVNKTGITVFQDVIYQFLYHSENDEFLVCVQAFAVIVKATAGIHTARAADLLKQVVHGRFQPKVLKGRG